MDYMRQLLCTASEVVLILNPSTLRAKAGGISEFEINLVYTVSSSQPGSNSESQS